MAALWDLCARAEAPRHELPGETVPALFWAGVQARGDQTWLREKRLGLWQAWTWKAAGEAVREMALGLDRLDLPHQAVVGILANTRLEWLLADLAIQSAGCVANGIYPTDAASQVAYLCADSQTQALFVEDDEQLDKVLEVRAELPHLRWIVVMDTRGLQHFSDPGVMSLSELRRLGSQHPAPARFEQRLQALRPDHLGILVYTSGTTGKPKGAMHLQQGLVAALRGASRNIAQRSSDERLCFLPLCHIAERMIGAYSALLTGARLNFVERPETFAENLREVAPHLLFAVPRVWEKLYSGASLAVAEAGPVSRAFYAWAIHVGHEVAQRVLAAERPKPLLRLRYRLADWLVLGAVRRALGLQRARLLISGAAPIAPDLIRWYLALGLPMVEGWGMTETCAHGTLSLPWDMRPGTVGPASPGVEMKVDESSGELLTRGPHLFAGYLNRPEASSAAFDAQGWFRTGDVGRLEPYGHFRITDRMKDIIITAGGKNITPSEIENQLKFSPYITDAVVIGDRRPYLTALIMIDQDMVERFAQEQDLAFAGFAGLTRAPEVRALIAKEVDRVNAEFARVEQIKDFRLLDTQLSAEDEELTPTMKLKRSLVQKKYAALIEAMY
ncbi:long-chain acyl-CoA synthetase [Inhella inkyongensis]|uniref:Long-chain acyl-CoA synthetase n=1 Tax=Inhella inkyongensis TaxID=392593 RepID=A0A840S1P7_9BURK|nr:long-chain fatty acid--CoA ligase [Inhella inkyongensis]MBB5204215.1 long-chain acyl-CoA synthetase [Inhella inkyongensis]